MITTVTLNAAIDKTYYVEQLQLGRVHRVTKQIAEPGGKGINVAKVIRLLGGEVAASGLIAGRNGDFIEEQVALRGIRTSFVRVAGESRLCLNIMDEAAGSSTEVLEQGAEASETGLAELKGTLQRLAQESSVVVLSGSLAAGAPSDLYAELIGIIRSAGARAFLDTSGKALNEALPAKPDFIKPNEQELAQWLGRDHIDEEACIEAARKLADGGIAQVCVTLGEKGTIAFIDGVGYRALPPAIHAVNTVGCGDSFVAGMALGEERGLPPAERLRMATAASAANAMSEKAGHIDCDLYQAFVRQADVRPL